MRAFDLAVEILTNEREKLAKCLKDLPESENNLLKADIEDCKNDIKELEAAIDILENAYDF